jgi:hypothetical protein
MVLPENQISAAYRLRVSKLWSFYRYLVSVLSIVHLVSVLSIVPPKKRPKLCYQALAVSVNQIEVFRSGIIDKTAMNEAVEQFWHEICYMGKVSTLSFSL